MTCGPLSHCCSQGRTGQDWAGLGSPHSPLGQGPALPSLLAQAADVPRFTLVALGPTLSSLCQRKGRVHFSLRLWQRCEGQGRTSHNDVHFHLCQQGRVPSSIPLGWHSTHGVWPLLLSPDPVVTDDGQNQQGCGVEAAEEHSQQNRPHCLERVAGLVMTL